MFLNVEVYRTVALITQLPLLTGTQPLTPARVCPPIDRIIEQVQKNTHTILPYKIRRGMEQEQQDSR